jgi:hypothetical protein
MGKPQSTILRLKLHLDCIPHFVSPPNMPHFYQVRRSCPGLGAGGGRTLVERTLVESPFLHKPDFGRIHFNKFGLW